MSLLHSFYCWGHVGVVLLSTIFFSVFGIVNWKILACIWALVPVLNACLFVRTPIAPLIEEGETGMSMGELFCSKVFWLMTVSYTHLPQLQRIMQVIMKDDAWRKKLTEKTLAFEKHYPVMVRSGFICMMVIPLVFLILMFSLESKLVYLILWIVSLLALILYLLIVEYLHEEMKKKSVLGEMSSEELMKILKGENNK